MKEHKIVVNISDSGEIHAETFGMEGGDCADELSRLMRDIATVTGENRKPEFFKNKTSATKTVKNKQGEE